MGIRTQEKYAKLVFQMESLSNKLVIFMLQRFLVSECKISLKAIV